MANVMKELAAVLKTTAKRAADSSYKHEKDAAAESLKDFFDSLEAAVQVYKQSKKEDKDGGKTKK